MRFVTLAERGTGLEPSPAECVVDADRVLALTENHYPAGGWQTSIHLGRSTVVVVKGRAADVRRELERPAVEVTALDPFTARDNHRRETGHEHIDIVRGPLSPTGTRTSEARCSHTDCEWRWSSTRNTAARVQTAV